MRDSNGFAPVLRSNYYSLIHNTMKELNEFLGKLDACEVLGAVDNKTITILSPLGGHKLRVSYYIKTDENGLMNDDLVFQAVMSVGSDKRNMAHFGATNGKENQAIVRWVQAKVRACEDARDKEVRAIDDAVSQWLR